MKKILSGLLLGATVLGVGCQDYEENNRKIENLLLETRAITVEVGDILVTEDITPYKVDLLDIEEEVKDIKVKDEEYKLKKKIILEAVNIGMEGLCACEEVECKHDNDLFAFLEIKDVIDNFDNIIVDEIIDTKKDDFLVWATPKEEREINRSNKLKVKLGYIDNYGNIHVISYELLEEI